MTLAAIDVKEERRRCAARFFHGRIPDQIDDATAEKLRKYLDLNPGGHVSPTITKKRRTNE